MHIYGGVGVEGWRGGVLKPDTFYSNMNTSSIIDVQIYSYARHTFPAGGKLVEVLSKGTPGRFFSVLFYHHHHHHHHHHHLLLLLLLCYRPDITIMDDWA